MRRALVTPEHRLVQKLRSVAPLADAEAAAVCGIRLDLASLAAGEDVFREHDRVTHCCLLLEGFLYRYKVLPNGGRQILSFHNRGDIPDLHGAHMTVMDHSLGALTPSRVAYIPHLALQELAGAHPGIAAALWRDTIIDGSISREWLTQAGRRSAYQRLAHLICELFVKARLAGLAADDGYKFPVTQNELADALGLSLGHVHRTVQELRNDGLIVLNRRFLSIPDCDALKAAALFNPAYLHLEMRSAPEA